MYRLRDRWLVLVLGGILLATTVLFGPVTSADAQGQGRVRGRPKAKSKNKFRIIVGLKAKV
jgi:hypothetical protein